MDLNYASLVEHVNGVVLQMFNLWLGMAESSLRHPQPGERKHAVKINGILKEKKMKEEWKS